MKLSDFIKSTLDELDIAKQHSSKKNYLVEELVFEINVTTIKELNGTIDIFIGNIGGDASKERSHKITLKLKPRGNRNSNRMNE